MRLASKPTIKCIKNRLHSTDLHGLGGILRLLRVLHHRARLRPDPGRPSTNCKGSATLENSLLAASQERLHTAGATCIISHQNYILRDILSPGRCSVFLWRGIVICKFGSLIILVLLVCLKACCGINRKISFIKVAVSTAFSDGLCRSASGPDCDLHTPAHTRTCVRILPAPNQYACRP